MAAWTYKGYSIVQKNRYVSRYWLSTATFSAPYGEFQFIAKPPRSEGYKTEMRAQEETEKFTQLAIDRLGEYEVIAVPSRFSRQVAR